MGVIVTIQGTLKLDVSNIQWMLADNDGTYDIGIGDGIVIKVSAQQYQAIQREIFIQGVEDEKD